MAASVSLTDKNGVYIDLKQSTASPGVTRSVGTGAMATAQVSVGTGSTLIVAARADRASVTITNLGTVDIYIGNTGVTAGTGTLLVGTKGAAITIPTTAAVYGIGASAQSVSFMENY